MDRDSVHQCSWTYDAEGNRCWTADRRAREVFAAAETLADAAAATGTAWSSMVGHWFKTQSKRRPDAMKTTTGLTEALTDFRVIETPQDLTLFGGTGAVAVDPLVCSDPLSIIATYDETCLPAT